MNMGRPTEFDRQDVLEKAMGLFWRKGYEATGLTELTKEMGIGRQSLYNAFGDKHGLFVESIKHYSMQNTRPLIDLLTAPGSGISNIRKALESVVELTNSGDCRGCLLTNSIVELASHDEEVAEVVRSAIGRLENAFKLALERSIESGEISQDLNPRAYARFLNNTLQGMIVLGKASTSKTILRDVVKVALSKLV